MNTTYQPLTLATRRDGNRYGTVTSNIGDEPVEYTVKVESRQQAGTTYYYVAVVGGDIKVYADAGMVVRRGSAMTLKSRAADGTLSAGYNEYGTLASNIESVVHQYLHSVDYAQREAAKTPEQKAEEAAAHRKAVNAGRNQVIARKAQDLLDTIDAEVPESTIHYAVEQARRALVTLIREADKGSIQTNALKAV